MGKKLQGAEYNITQDLKKKNFFLARDKGYSNFSKTLIWMLSNVVQ